LPALGETDAMGNQLGLGLLTPAVDSRGSGCAVSLISSADSNLRTPYPSSQSRKTMDAVQSGCGDAAHHDNEPRDLSHHFSQMTKNRAVSKIKKYYKYFKIPGIGQLAGGKSMPHPRTSSPV
jgi:hypothetical protein